MNKKCDTCFYLQVTESKCMAIEFENAKESEITDEECKYYTKADIGTYGFRHREFLKEKNIVKFENMLMDNTLESYLIRVNKQAHEMLNNLYDIEIKKTKLPEDTMERARIMNNIKTCMEEIVLNDIVYSF